MPVDNSIYFQQQVPDILGNVQKGLSMREMIDQRNLQKDQLARQKKVDLAYQAGIVQNPDGTSSYDGKRTLSALAKEGLGKEYIQSSKDLAESEKQQIEAQKAKLLSDFDFMARELPNVKDQASYTSALERLKARGVDVSKEPQQYDPNYVLAATYRVLSFKDQLEQQNKERDFGLKQQELGIKRQEAKQKALSGENLPIDKKKYVENLATKNANKVSIANQIDAVMSKWDSLSEDQKIVQGGQLLKTLNSPEGADAIGKEEAERLGNKLQFAMGNFTNDSPMRVGRDLEGFKQQAMGTASSLRSAVSANQSEVDRSMGRQPNMSQGNKPKWAK